MMATPTPTRQPKRRRSRLVCGILGISLLASPSQGYQPFHGEIARRLRRSTPIDPNDAFCRSYQDDDAVLSNRPLSCDIEEMSVENWIRSQKRSLVAFGTYAGDFNTFEYAQGLRYYLATLRQQCGIDQFALVVNTTPRGGQLVADLLDLPEEAEVWVDNTGSLARKFNVSRGWLPDSKVVPPLLKLVGMMPWGMGAPGTLPSIVQGYVGVPPDRYVSRQHYAWVEDAFSVGQRHGRWPDSILVLDPTTGEVLHNKFDDFGFGTGSWPLRPFEKATLRLQSMVGITLRHWSDVMPNPEALDSGVLTQLGGCVVFDEYGRHVSFEWRDTGCCATVNFAEMIRELTPQGSIS
jgi:AhpC/TSA antioxidant enzyme